MLITLLLNLFAITAPVFLVIMPLLFIKWHRKSANYQKANAVLLLLAAVCAIFLLFFHMRISIKETTVTNIRFSENTENMPVDNQTAHAVTKTIDRYKLRRNPLLTVKFMLFGENNANHDIIWVHFSEDYSYTYLTASKRMPQTDYFVKNYQVYSIVGNENLYDELYSIIVNP